MRTISALFVLALLLSFTCLCSGCAGPTAALKIEKSPRDWDGASLYQEYYGRDPEKLRPALDKDLERTALELSKCSDEATLGSLHDRRAEIYIVLGQMKEARVDLEEALKCFKSSTYTAGQCECLNLMALCSFIEKDYGNAEKLLVQAKDLGTEKTPTMEYNMALVYEAQGKNKQALEIYDRLLKNASGRTDSVLFARAGLYSTMGRLDPALQDFSSLAGKRNSQNLSAKSFYYMGSIYELKKNPSQALKSYKAVIAEATFGWSEDKAKALLEKGGVSITGDMLAKSEKIVEEAGNLATDGFLAKAQEKIKALEGGK